MRIFCPNCQAAYEVPERLLDGGRLLRCVKCRHEWREGALPPEPEPVPAPAAAPQTPAPPPIPAQTRPPQPIDPPPHRGRAPLIAAWIASGLILAALIASFFAYQAPITEAWPPAARLYLWLGLASQG